MLLKTILLIFIISIFQLELKSDERLIEVIDPITFVYESDSFKDKMSSIYRFENIKRKNMYDKNLGDMNRNIKIPLSQRQVNAITSYLYYRGSAFNSKKLIPTSIFYKAVNDRDIDGMINFMLSEKSANLKMEEGNYKRAYNTARYILGEISQDELLRTYETNYSNMFPESK